MQCKQIVFDTCRCTIRQTDNPEKEKEIIICSLSAMYVENGKFYFADLLDTCVL